MDELIEQQIDHDALWTKCFALTGIEFTLEKNIESQVITAEMSEAYFKKTDPEMWNYLNG